ncbi:hypothetical protein BH23PLA1_BH23PLA1_04580 [soil metagenome]
MITPAMNPRHGVLLIVDDDELTRHALARLMGRHGWDVEEAATIAEGIDHLGLEHGEPECLILDLMLPDGDGETVLRRVRENHLQTRVVVTSGTGDLSRLESVRKLGADAILRKPIDVLELCKSCQPPGS